jgi:hypothetical protein
LLNDRRILIRIQSRIRIHISELWIRIREAQKQVDPVRIDDKNEQTNNPKINGRGKTETGTEIKPEVKNLVILTL